jgi:hypothetical protein
VKRAAVPDEAQAAVADRHALRTCTSADNYWLKYFRTCVGDRARELHSQRSSHNRGGRHVEGQTRHLIALTP